MVTLLKAWITMPIKVHQLLDERLRLRSTIARMVKSIEVDFISGNGPQRSVTAEVQFRGGRVRLLKISKEIGIVKSGFYKPNDEIHLLDNGKALDKTVHSQRQSGFFW